jgi:hypothetical protein
MTHSEIQLQLLNAHRKFGEAIAHLTDDQFMSAPAGKWTPGQHLEHICISVYQTSRAFKFPKFVVRLLFGKANRPSKSYDALIQKYKDKIAAGGVATGVFVPKSVPLSRKAELLKTLDQLVPQMVKRLQKYNDQQLDLYLLPHPLLGKVTLREMLYFTIYHVQHHKQLTMNN